MARSGGLPLNVLIVEDSEDDTRLIARELQRGGYEPLIERVEDETAMAVALDRCRWDVVLSDHSMPRFSAPAALKLLQGRSLEIPFIVVSGNIGEEEAVAMMKRGAADYVLKDNLVRLVPTIARELRDVEERRARRKADEALKDSRRRFELMARVSYDVLWDWDVTTDEVWRNQGLDRLFGYRSDQVEPTRNWWLDRIHPDDVCRVQESLRACVDGVTESWSSEYRFRRADGSYAYVLDRAHVLREAGRPVRVVGAMLDLTERKRVEEERRAAEQRLLQSQKMEALGRLAGGIAHDFNNLLTAILGYSDLLLTTTPADDPRRADLEEIRNAGERATNLTRQLLTFSRQQVIEPRVIDLNEVIRTVEKLLRRVIGEDVEVRTRLAAGLGRVRADPTQVEQVILNLAVNARDAMPKGGSLAIETASAEVRDVRAERYGTIAPGPAVRLTVRDTGCGMTPEVRARIFEPFFTTKEHDKGTGLGLSVVYDIVQQCGGAIEVSTEPGRGTTFAVYLPCIGPSAGGAERVRSVAATLDGSETVLLVEDETDVRRLVGRLLEGRGYKVLEASGPTDAERVVAEARAAIDLLITDLVLREGNGWELADRLSRARPALKTLYMSGYSQATAGAPSALGPASAFLQKPFTHEALLRKVRDVLDAGIEPSV